MTASVMMSSFTGTKDTEVGRLKAENQALLDELAQCQADKDFVWSLWKRLQVANPDITQAIGMVAQREKEKAEMKDRKVLEILNVKDDKIDELQKLVSNQSAELSELIIKKNIFEEEMATLERENVGMRVRLEELDSNIRNQASRDAIRELDKENLELKQELSRRSIEIEKLQKDTDDLKAIRDSHRERITAIEEENQEIGLSFENLTQENDETKKTLRKCDHQVSSLQKQLKAKSRELDAVRGEMADIWATHRQTAQHSTQQADVIRQLQNLQQDTQQMLQNTEGTHTMERMTLQTENQVMRSSEAELKRQLGQQSQTIDEQERLLQELQAHLESKNLTLKTMDGSGKGMNSRLTLLQDEVQELKYKLDNRSRSGSRSASPSPTRSRPQPKKGRGRGQPRSRSLCTPTEHTDSDIRIVVRKLENTEKKLSDTQLLLHFKSKELEELRTAHNRRLDRLKGVQVDHKLLKKQCAVLEQELYGPKKVGKKKLLKSTPKSLQKEDSDTVWNELAFYRKEAKNHRVENVNLQEECDALKVKLSQCDATVHELRSCLEQEREELQFVLEQQNERRHSFRQDTVSDQQLQDMTAKLEHYKNQLDRLRGRMERASIDQREIEEERSHMHEERRALKAEINSLRQQDASYRIKIADFKAEIARSKRESKSKKRKSQGKEKCHQYQKALNKSIQEMSRVFDDFNKEGWQDVSESEERTDDQTLTTTTGISLGEDIVNQAQNNTMCEGSFTDLSHTSTLSRGRPVSRVYSNDYRTLTRSSDVHTRTIALSPIHIPMESPVRPLTRSIGLSPVRLTPERPLTRSIGLSPVRLTPPAKAHVISKKTGLSPLTSSRQVAALKQRVTALITQVSVIKAAKDCTTRTNNALRATIEQLQTDLLTANTKAQSFKQNVLRLTTEVDRLRADKELLEQRIHDYSTDSSSVNLHTDQEYATLQHRLKASTGEVSRQLAHIKALKADNSAVADRLTQMTERVKSLERDNAQKRILTDDMKMKLRVVQENVKSEADVMEDVEHKIKTLSDINQRYKTQLDSFKTRLTVVTKEKCDNEDKVIKLSDELDRKSKLVSELQSKARSLQSTVAAVERTAQHQLTTLADHSEVAIDTAQAKLTQMDYSLREYAKFLKVLAHTLVNSTQLARQFCTQQKLKKELAKKGEENLDASLDKFKTVACDILNISQDELDDILHCQEVDTAKIQDIQKLEEQKKDKKWCKKWEKVLQNTSDFAVPLVDIFMEKVEERCRLASEIAVT